jgi:hypothetical protein
VPPFPSPLSTLAIPTHLTPFDLSKSRFFRAEGRVFGNNLGRCAFDRSDHPRFKSVSGLEPGISDQPARSDNGDKKSLLVGMIPAEHGAGKRKNNKKVTRDK